MRAAVQWLGFFAGPVLAALCYAWLPASYRDAGGAAVAFSHAGRVTLGLMVWMGCWWLTEAVDISATALLPLATLPLVGGVPINQVAAPYADPLIFLFMGGFLIALSMRRWGLDRRIALNTLRLVGTRPANMVGGFMLATAGLSAFVSNTATTAIMVPIAMSVVQLVRRSVGKPQTDRFAVSLMLGLAFAASIGGLATIIGTPPNAFLAGFLRRHVAPEYQLELTFARWLLIGLPVSLAMLPAAWLLLTQIMYPLRFGRVEGGERLIREELASLGRLNRGEWSTLVVFLLTAACWIFRPLLVHASLDLGGRVIHPLAGLSDPAIAMLGALALFVIPVDAGGRVFVMDWKAAGDLPWGILVLFGGGLSLAAAVDAHGVAGFIGAQAMYFRGLPPSLLVLAVTALVMLLTELTSNTATTATLLPVLAALAPGLDVHPYLLIFPATIAASCAFMLPVATPPNAIVFGSGEVTIAQMAKAGWWLDVVGAAIITLLAMFLLGPALGAPLGG